MEMTAERKIQKATIKLLQKKEKFAFLSGILMLGNSEVVDGFPTAGTDGYNKIYGRAFVDACNEKQLRFVILHEASHIMLKHVTTWKKLYEEDPSLANQACDHVINLMLQELDPDKEICEWDNMPFPAITCADPRFRGMHAKQVFDILKKEQEKQKQNGQGQGGGNGNGALDELLWEKGKELSDEQKKQIERDIDQAIRQGQIAANKIAGTGSGEFARALEELLEPEVDWRDVLREFIKATCSGKDVSSWRRVNRRFIGNDIYMPSLIGESVGHLGIGVDMSGSTWVGNVFRDFMSEVVGLCNMVNPERVDLIYWDTSIGKHEEYKQGDYHSMAGSTQPTGGGGTMPSCVTAYLEKNKIVPDAFIMLSDGYVGSDWGGKWPCPIMWVIAGDFKGYAATGQTIHIGDRG